MTRDQIQSLKEGVLLMTTLDSREGKALPGARWTDPAPISRIFARGDDVNGRAYVCAYRRISSDCEISFSAKEGDDRVRIANPEPHQPRRMYERAYGNKYDRNLTTIQIAALLRGEIKQAVKDGRLPKGKYSVTGKYFSGGSSIDVRIKEISIPVLNPERVLHGEGGRDEPRRPIYSAKGAQVLDTLKNLSDQWNHDGSDIQSDYFDVRFYFNATYNSKIENAERERILMEGFGAR